MEVLERISKEEFFKAYNNHPPNKFVELGFKYFSKDNKPEDSHVKKWTKRFLITLLILLIIGGIANVPMSIMTIPIIIYAGLVFGIVTYMVASIVMNNKRIKKIAKELNISIPEYQILAKFYYV